MCLRYYVSAGSTPGLAAKKAGVLDWKKLIIRVGDIDIAAILGAFPVNSSGPVIAQTGNHVFEFLKVKWLFDIIIGACFPGQGFHIPVGREIDNGYLL